VRRVRSRAIDYHRSMSSSQAERQLILLSAGTAARRRAMCEQAGQLIGEVDWP
jgi:hypothetical protein